MNSALRLFLKKCYLYLNDKTVKSRFFFDGEYARWKEFNEKREVINKFAVRESANRQNIHFLVPGVKISGGIAVIFQYANRLLERGYKVTILSLNKYNDGSWFPNQKVEIIPYDQTKKILKSDKVDVLIATAYSTAFTVDMARAKSKFYFIQSDESRFFPNDTKLSAMIRKTYELPLKQIVAVSWLKKWLKNEFDKEASIVPNGLDLNIFHKTKPLKPKSSRPRVLIEGAINVPFKGMDEAYAAVKDLDCEHWIVSNNGKPKKEWKFDQFFENVPLGEMPKIYSSCDILLKMSQVESFCYPPLEMMAGGGACVIRKVTGIEEYAINGSNCLIVNDVEQARAAVKKLIDDSELREKIIKNGYETAKKWSWKISIEMMENIVIYGKIQSAVYQKSKIKT